MKLPGGERAIVALEKLVDYCLDPEHDEGKHQAVVFQAALGIGRDDAGVLRDALLDAAKSAEAVLGEGDEYGQRYIIDFQMQTAAGSAAVRSAWIVRTGEDFPRFVTSYVL